MDCIVLCTGGCLQVERVITLDSFDVCRTESSGEERVLSVGLHPAAPAGIPENVYVRGPEGQTCEAAVVLHFTCLVEFGASLIGNNVANLPY